MEENLRYEQFCMRCANNTPENVEVGYCSKCKCESLSANLVTPYYFVPAEVVEELGEKALSDQEISKLKMRIEAMSREEWAVVVSCIPVDICLNRISSELETLLALKEKVKALNNIM